MTEPVFLSLLDRRFADTITRLDSHPCEALWQAAALTSHAVEHGHICLYLEEAAGCELAGSEPFAPVLRTPPLEAWRRDLEPCDTIGRPGDYTPLVLDDAGRLYVHRSWDHERRTAEAIISRSEALPVDETRLFAALDRYFPPAGDEPDMQREAARVAVMCRFTVISGGPGTGKTATVARILALMAELAGDTHLRIALAAPTGKAAMRLRRSLALAAEQLPHQPVCLPQEVATIHRLLKTRPGSLSFYHNREHPLPCDLLVIDEASMIDLPLMARVMEALPGQARIILLGDRDQLASVEAGAVLADICSGARSGDCQGGFAVTGRPAVVHLTKSYRFSQESGIGVLSRLINDGDTAGVVALLREGAHPDVVWRHDVDPACFRETFAAMVRQGYRDYLRSRSPANALESLERFRVLSPHREGSRGVGELNRLCGYALGLNGPGDGRECRLWPVMIAANSYDLELFNGDTGVFMEVCEEGRTAVWFSDPDRGVRHVSPRLLPPWESAFAITVHKSQGSEFDRVVLILPEQPSEAVCRELLYTAVTRARQRIEIWGPEAVLRRAVERRTGRNSGLGERLWGETGGRPACCADGTGRQLSL
jgi:exodeoxyribonuclease V alpha subunit